MLRLKEVASQSQTFPKRALEKQNVNRTLLLPRPATGRTLQLFSIDRPPVLAVGRVLHCSGFSAPNQRARPARMRFKHETKTQRSRARETRSIYHPSESPRPAAAL